MIQQCVKNLHGHFARTLLSAFSRPSAQAGCQAGKVNPGSRDGEENADKDNGTTTTTTTKTSSTTTKTLDSGSDLDSLLRSLCDGDARLTEYDSEEDNNDDAANDANDNNNNNRRRQQQQHHQYHQQQQRHHESAQYSAPPGWNRALTSSNGGRHWAPMTTTMAAAGIAQSGWKLYEIDAFIS